MRPKRWPQALLCLLALLLWAAPGMAAPNYYETRLISKQVKNSFHSFLAMWREELYFDMYDQGQIFSQQQLNKAEFAQRMVDLEWKPSLKAPLLTRVQVDYRNFAILDVILEMENKVNPLRKIEKKYTYHMILEKTGWKFDLTKVIRVPFTGKFVDVAAEKKRLDLIAAQEAKDEAESAANKARMDARQAATEAANAKLQGANGAQNGAPKAGEPPPEADQPPAEGEDTSPEAAP